MNQRSSVLGAVPLARPLFSECVSAEGSPSPSRFPGTDGDTLRAAIEQHVVPGATVYTDEHRGYNALAGYSRGTVNHGAKEYVGAGDIHINSAESMWAVLKRSIYGTWHHVSVKHLGRYVNEATFRLNEGNVQQHTLDRLAAFAANTFGTRITYEELIV